MTRTENPDVLEQAVDWFVRLRAGSVSTADRHAHAEWLAADTEHARVYASVEQDWQELDGLEDRARSRLAQLNLKGARRQRHRAWGVGSLAAAAAALVVVVLLVQLRDRPTEQRFETVKAEQRQIALQDGSRVHLNTDSEIDVRFAASAREVTLHRGEGFFDVGYDPRRPFIVRAGGSSVTAVGTRFAVLLGGRNDLTVTVLEGQVAIAPSVGSLDTFPPSPDAAEPAGVEPSPGRLFLAPDRQARLGPDGSIRAVEVVNAEDVTAWQTGKLVFDNAPLREVVREVSRYTPGEIRVASGVPDHPVTGIIQIRSAGSMADLLSRVVPVRAVAESAELTILYDAP